MSATTLSSLKSLSCRWTSRANPARKTKRMKKKELYAILQTMDTKGRKQDSIKSCYLWGTANLKTLRLLICRKKPLQLLTNKVMKASSEDTSGEKSTTYLEEGLQTYKDLQEDLYRKTKASLMERVAKDHKSPLFCKASEHHNRAEGSKAYKTRALKVMCARSRMKGS